MDAALASNEPGTRFRRLAAGGDAAAVCTYCHLPMPAARDGGEQFCCFGCRFAAEITRSGGESGQTNWMLTRLGVAVFLTMGVMVFSFYLYGEEIYAPAGPASAVQQHLGGVMRYCCLLMATPVLLLLGGPIAVNAREELRHGRWSVDVLVVLGVSAAFALSYWATLTANGATYFETACVILVLITLGRWLEATARLKATEAARGLAEFMPATAVARRAGGPIEVPVAALCVGDVVLVPAGQRLVADGVVAEGRASVDEQMLTGESVPVVKGPGDAVCAGTLAVDGPLWIRATALGADSAVGRLAALLEQARLSKGYFQQLADRVVAIFVPVTVVLALAGAALGAWRGGVDDALRSALAVMLIACPCALGIATPLALWVAIGQAARRGAVFRSARSLETLAAVRTVCFDKTGTLTTGSPVVAAFVAVDAFTGDNASAGDAACAGHDAVVGDNASGGDDDAWLAAAAGLAQASTHAYSRSVVEFARRRGIVPASVDQVRSVPGCGMSGRWRGRELRWGSPGWAAGGDGAAGEAANAVAGTAAAGQVRNMQRLAQGVSVLGVDGRVVAVAGFDETLRPGVPSMIAALRALGRDVRVLTGDHFERGAQLAAALDVPVSAALTPARKLERLHAIRAQSGAVAMVGDGLNDAPALQAADVGVALGCGADLSRESADICLLGDDLEVLPWLVRLSRRTVRTIRINLFWAFFYNTAGIVLALSGRLSPVVAAIAMVASSLLVVGHSLRLMGADGEEEGTR